MISHLPFPTVPCPTPSLTTTVRTITLKSGRRCELIRLHKLWLSDYYVVAFPPAQGEPRAHEVAEMLELGIAQARQLAARHLGDPEAYSVLYSGHSARRAKGWHLHLVLLGSRWKKAWLYGLLSFKNVVQALRLRQDDAREK